MIQIKRTLKALVGFVVSAVVCIGGLGLTSQAASASAPSNSATTSSGTASSTTRDVTVVAFQQTWNSIAKECTETYGPEGVGYVEISPPMETIQGTEWWTSYQPVSYKFDSKLGTEAELKQMITTCKAAGVGIIADAIVNHMAGAGRSGTGTAGTAYGENGDGDFPSVPYTSSDFHSCTKNISDYTNATEVQECRLTGLQDLNTGSESVQTKIATYMKNLLDLGVAGFRVDAVKHVLSADISAIKAKLAQLSGRSESDIYWAQEVIGASGEASEIQPSNYTSTGDVSEFSFAYQLKQYFAGSISNLKNITSGLLDSSSAQVFVDNWDTERNGSTLNYKSGRKYAMANAFMLAYGYGSPYIESGYKWDKSDDGAPNATNTSVPDSYCGTDSPWLCTQRWTSIRGMIRFHNAVNGTKVTNWWDNGSNNIGFGRGSVGYLALNNSSSAVTQTYQTSLAAGTYCNVYATGNCSETVTVKSDGTFTAKVAAHSAVAIYTGATPDSWKGTSATDPSDPVYSDDDDSNKTSTGDNTVTVYYKNSNNWDNVYIHYGSGSSWTSVPGEKMSKACGDYYSKTISLVDGSIEVVFNDGNGTWDNATGGGNYTISKSGEVTIADKSIAESNPCPTIYEPKTRLVVHYQPKNGDSTNRGVYVWGTAKDGTTVSGTYYSFTGTDSFGKVFEKKFDGAYDKLNFIITTSDWNKDGGDRSIDASSGTGEAWVVGGSDDTLTSAPEGYGKSFKKLTVTLHYHRSDNTYDGWDVWKWSENENGSAAAFASHDTFGKIATYTMSSSSKFSNPQFIIRYGGDAWTAKDIDANRTIPQSAITMTGDDTAKAEIWLVSGDETVYTNSSVLDLQPRISSAEYSGMKTITAKLNQTVTTASIKDKVSLSKGEISSVTASGNIVTITTKDDLDPSSATTVTIEGYGKSTAVAGSMVRTSEFDDAYAYNGDDLGFTYSRGSTTFKLWAPTAKSVKLNTYKSVVSDSELAKSYDMTKGTGSSKGVWTVTLKGDHKDMAYDFTLSFANGNTNEAVDPYAKAAVANGGRSVVLSNTEMTPQAWSSRRMAGSKSSTNAVITELHVRDFTSSKTSGVSARNRGKYLGVSQTGTHTSSGAVTGVDYLKKQGVTHAQILPMYDYGSVNETAALNDSNYNWGYDPVNYNVPEGSYSSNAADPRARIVEMKQMVQGLHRNGIRVIMDVVYNHVYDANSHAFNLTVPGYYFRYTSTGALANGSGCGNDTASERAMMRKYIVDSVVYWAKAYNIDGFRFDLMGNLDITTMKAVRTALNKIDKSIIIIGEGWDLDTTLDDSEKAIQPNASQFAGIGFFNDSLRNAIKGSVFSDTDTGFVTGKTGSESLIATNMLGCLVRTGEPTCNGSYSSASQVVNYVEVHDNLTLYDKLRASSPGDDDATTVKRSKLATSMVLLSQGIPEMQLGQEFLRTKGGNSNSYNSGDSVNAIDWDRTTKYASAVSYTRGLIALRKAIPALRMSSYKDISANSEVLAQSNGLVAIRLKDKTGTYMIAFNGSKTDQTVSGLSAGKYTVLSSDGSVNTAAVTALAGGRRVKASQVTLTSVADNGEYTVPALSAAVLKVGTVPTVPSAPSRRHSHFHGNRNKRGHNRGRRHQVLFFGYGNVTIIWRHSIFVSPTASLFAPAQERISKGQ